MDSAPITEQQLPVPQQKLQTLPDKHQNEEQFKAAQASRRSRKDIEGRDFICGCGKKYLSYPALYTHIKTKHDGKQPQGTMKYSTTAPPKKSKTKLEQQHLNYLISQVKRQDLKLMDLLAPKFLGSTPLSSRLKSKILEKPLTDTYHNLLKTTTSPLKLTKQSPLEQHLIAWLIGAGEYVSEKLHDQYQWFARTVKECYYQMGGQVYNKCFSKKDSGLCYVPHFKVEKVKYLPLICDFYVRFFLVYEYTELNANLMELILTDFCHWLNRRKCTFIEIILNKEYKLTAPLKIEQDSKNDRERGGDEDEEKCEISEMIEPDSQKEDESKQGLKPESNQQNDNAQNGAEDFLQNDEPSRKGNNSIIEQGQQNNIIDGVANSQNNGVAQAQPKAATQNGHQNCSLQQNPGAQSSQQLPQQEHHSQVNGERAQNETPQHQHPHENGNEDAHQEKL